MSNNKTQTQSINFDWKFYVNFTKTSLTIALIRNT